MMCFRSARADCRRVSHTHFTQCACGCTPAGQSYWESNILGTVRYPEGVKFISVSFLEYFGTTAGQAIREWCIEHGWALSWALAGQIPPPPHAKKPSKAIQYCQDPRRLLDPLVLVCQTNDAREDIVRKPNLLRSRWFFFFFFFPD